jgi:excisionase family DNA binding protein
MFEHIPDIMTFKECQNVLKIGKNSLLDLLHDGSIEAFKIGNRWKIPKEAVLNYILKIL